MWGIQIYQEDGHGFRYNIWVAFKEDVGFQHNCGVFWWIYNRSPLTEGRRDVAVCRNNTSIFPVSFIWVQSWPILGLHTLPHSVFSVQHNGAAGFLLVLLKNPLRGTGVSFLLQVVIKWCLDSLPSCPLPALLYPPVAEAHSTFTVLH